MGHAYLQTIPEGRYHSLKSLSLCKCPDTSVDVFALLDLLVFSTKVRLSDLKLVDFDIDKDLPNTRTELVKKVALWNTPLSLNSLEFGDFR